MLTPNELPESEFSSAKNARIAVLGALRLETPDHTLDAFGSRHAATILAILALHQGPVSRSKLASELWPGEDEEVLRPRLRQELFRLKKALGEFAHLVTADREFVALRRLCVSTDVAEFLSDVQAGRGAKGERRIELWIRAANLYKDDVLVDYDGEWLNHERSSLQGIRRRLLLNLVQLLIDRGRATDAVSYARELVRLNTRDEASQCALAQALHAAGDAAAARDHLRRVEARLQREGRKGGDSLVRAWKTLESEPDLGSAPTTAPETSSSVQLLGRPLPVALHPMFGREAEVDRILALIGGSGADSVRLLTIVGFGGMGKTRLAVEVARKVSGLGTRHVGFVSLIEVDDPEVLIQNVAAVVCPSREQSQDLFSTIASQLQGRKATLVLDNFEDLIPQGVAVVERLLAENDGLRLLVTSRMPLGVLGEQLFPLSPLPLPLPSDSLAVSMDSPSVALFLDQTMRVRPDFVLDDPTLESIVRLIGAVEGIPLAILLTACRMRTLSPQEAERAIVDRLSFLSGPAGGFEARHRTMRQCIEWSSEELPDPVRKFWIRLAIFRGGWSLAAATTVLEEPSAMDYLEVLCDSSLVHREQCGGRTRYAMFEPVRQYAEELLQADDRQRCSPRLAKYVMEFLVNASASWFAGERAPTFDFVESEMDNIRAALSWCLIHDHAFAQNMGAILRSYWSDNGHHAEACMWLDKILDLPKDSWRPRERILMMLTEGIMLMDQANYAKARQLYRDARAICVEIGDASGSAWIDLNMAHIDVQFGYIARAMPVQQEALAAFESQNNTSGIAHAMTDLGRSLLCSGEPEEALEKMHGALRLRHEVGWDNGTAFAEAGLGGGLLKLGHLAVAYEHLHAARDICRRTKDSRILVDVLADFADCCLELGKLTEAASALSELRDICRRIGDALGSIYCDIREARYELACGRPDLAVLNARRSLDVSLRLKIPIAILESLRAFAALAYRLEFHEYAMSLALGIEHVREEQGIATWPRRSKELEGIIRAEEGLLDLGVQAMVCDNASSATVNHLVDIAHRIERGVKSADVANLGSLI
jgi:non-specific serine/threonine protein kinase